MRVTQEEQDISNKEREGVVAEPVLGKESPAAAAQAGVTEPETEKQGRERRIYSRLDKQVVVRHNLFENKKLLKKAGFLPENVSPTKNISAGGVLFSSSESFPPGSILQLEMELPDEDKPLECLARVVRVDEAEPGRLYSIAVCFLDMSNKDRAKIDRYIRKEQ
jgi:c-di-GMP-binding flagellar brake protein YcgR